MNLSEFIVDEDNITFQSNVTEQPQQPGHYQRTAIQMVRYILHYVCLALGVPGNILSAIIWLRRHVTSKNSSALYLAVLAINDLLFLIINTVFLEAIRLIADWLYYCLFPVYMTTQILEPLLVLGFSVERLIAIICPLQVRFMRLYDCVLWIRCIMFALMSAFLIIIIIFYGGHVYGGLFFYRCQDFNVFALFYAPFGNSWVILDLE